MIDKVKSYFKNNTILLQCLISSIVLHTMLIYLFYKHPFMLYAQSIFHPTIPTATKVVAEAQQEEAQDQILKEIFEHLTIAPRQLQTPYDLAALPAVSDVSPKAESLLDHLEEGAELVTVEVTPPEQVAIDTKGDIFSSEETIEQLFSTNTIEDKKAPLATLSEMLKEASPSHIIDAPVVSYVDMVEEEAEPHFRDSKETVFSPAEEREMIQDAIPKSRQELSTVKLPNDPIRIPTQVGTWTEGQIANDHTDNRSPEIAASDIIIPYSHPSLSKLDPEGLLEIVSIENWNHCFDTKVSISSPTDEKGYIFSITLNPVHAELIERMSQNFYFIIDASASIDRQKFSLYKRSVLKALSALQEGDRFNIIVLDKKLTRLSQRNLIFNLKSVHMAEDFLEKLNQANFITSVDLLESLEKLSEAIEDSPQMHTALLLTNGQSSEGFQGQQSRIKSFIEKNNGKIALYAAAVGGKNNLVTLDMLCNISGGKMLYSDTNAAFPRKLTNLVKSLKAPLAKDIRITAAAINNKAGLTLLTTKQTLPAIYAGEPYTIVGTMERLCDIHLTIEARHDDEWVTIEKEISFDSAKLDTSLAVEWKKAQLTAHYQNFLKEPKIKHLKNARELLQLEHGKVAVE